MNIEFSHTPVSVIFFILAGAFAFLSQDNPYLLDFAYASIWLFIHFGLIRWAANALLAIPVFETAYDDDGNPYQKCLGNIRGFADFIDLIANIGRVICLIIALTLIFSGVEKAL